MKLQVNNINKIKHKQPKLKEIKKQKCTYKQNILNDLKIKCFKFIVIHTLYFNYWSVQEKDIALIVKMVSNAIQNEIIHEKSEINFTDLTFCSQEFFS